MKQRIAFSKLFQFLCGLVLLSHTAFAIDAVPGEYLVKYKDGSTVAAISLRSIPGLRLLHHNPTARLYKIGVQSVSEPQTLARVLHDPNVEYVVPNLILNAYRAPVSTEALQEQWALAKIHAPEAWAKAGNKGSRKVLVAVIDTGADYNHSSLKDNMVKGYDFINHNDDPMDKTAAGGNPGHGTHCSGIIGATGVVEGGTSGVSPEVAIMPLRFLNEMGQGDLNAGIEAIDYAIKNKAQVISASWGATVSESQAQPLIEAVKRADDAGVIFVVAAANNGANNDAKDVYPANANFPNTITVAASGKADEKPSWSNFGKRKVHIASPGDAIISTLPGNKYGNLSGTSMATPLVAGLVAFLKAQDASLTGAQVRSLLQLSGPKVSIETACNCRIDALASVDKLMDEKMYIVPAAATMGVGQTQQFGAARAKGSLTYSVTDSSIGTISESGLFTAMKLGMTAVVVTDASGQMSRSLDVNVVDKATEPPAGSCPLGDQQLCDIICKISPDFPFCKSL